MATSKAQVFNMALGNVGITGRVEDADNESSAEAIACRVYYDQCFGQVLEARAWPFCTKKLKLTVLALDDVLDTEWAYRYQYPVDCALAQKIMNPTYRTEGQDQKIPFEVMDQADGYGKVIYTDQVDAILKFNQKITDLNKLSFSAIQALAILLAANIATPLRVDAKIIAGAQKQANGWLAEAANFAMRERQDDPQPQSEFVTGRG